MKFQQHISLFLALFLLFFNGGFAVNVHYCGGEIASVFPIYLEALATTQDVEKECCDTLIDSKQSCCNDKVVHFQKKADNFVVKKFFSATTAAVLVSGWIPLIYSKTSYFKLSSAAYYLCEANAPPFFKLYQKYIFYA